MLSEDLFRSVLLRPASEHGADALLAASGYATPSMAAMHMGALAKKGVAPRIDLVVGMALRGIARREHLEFQRLSGGAEGSFECSYLVRGGAASHAKVFVWARGGRPVAAFAGSANYTRTGFGGKQIEAVERVDPALAKRFFDGLKRKSIPCGNEVAVAARVPVITTPPPALREEAPREWVSLPLVISAGGRKGEVHHHSGLNWGQREGRKPDQAYVPIPADVRRSGFFPPLRRRFSVATDDGASLRMVVAQEEGKALHSVPDNGEIGRWFRRRLGLAPGAYVTRESLEAYGRTTVDFCRLGDGRYYLDFSV